MRPTTRTPARTRPRPDSMRDVDGRVDRKAHKTIEPNRWMGECGYLIGPFTCRHLAECFANTMVEFGQYECMSHRVMAATDGFYVQTVKVGEPVVVTAWGPRRSGASAALSRTAAGLRGRPRVGGATSRSRGRG